jgi:hypothetical protein
MDELRKHPGYFGLTSQGVIAIHADWPMYPEEHGADLALLWLTAFPQGTSFTSIDDIDRCNLFLVGVKCSNREDPFDQRNFHVAIWHKDLLELSSEGFVEGVSAVNARRWEEVNRSELPAGDLYFKRSDGTMQAFSLPPLEDYCEDDMFWPEFAPGGIAVTASGRTQAASSLAQAAGDHTILGQRVQRLLGLSFFDIAVREACVALEHEIKTYLNSEKWGDALVEEFILRLRDGGRLLESHLRVLRAQIRTAFKFIRNDFMHNFVDIDDTQCRAILFRLARTKVVVDHLVLKA